MPRPRDTLAILLWLLLWIVLATAAPKVEPASHALALGDRME